MTPFCTLPVKLTDVFIGENEVICKGGGLNHVRRIITDPSDFFAILQIYPFNDLCNAFGELSCSKEGGVFVDPVLGGTIMC